jgi:carboxyl-terminal processing protease
MDPQKRYFLQQDIETLKAYEKQLDDQMKAGDFTFFNKMNDIFEIRLKEAEGFYQSLLEKPFDLNQDGTLETDAKKLNYCANSEELKERWRKTFVLSVLDEIYNAEDKQEKAAKDKKDTKIETRDELEAKARKKLSDNYGKLFKRLMKQKREDRLEIYLNSITSAFDPHTNYFAPKEKKNFDIRMSGHLEGIGAQLQEDNGNTKVTHVVPGSPSWKQGELKENDLIIKVAQGDKEPVDIVNMDLDDVVQLIRGPKGTEVRLTIRKPDGKEKEISIIRDVVVMEETFAKSTIVQDKKTGLRIGFINLPSFYADFENPAGRRCSRDMRDEVRKLKAEKVDGIVIDLRNNGGGSLTDVVDIGGYFVKQGPMVQVKSRDANPYVMQDHDGGKVEYDGPMAVMVNSFSASASEILAAALQDYKRAVIIGDVSTFGKGTVQRFYDLDDALGANYKELKPLGSIKITQQKFYRVNGGATQLKGVIPDIILPDLYSYIPSGEKSEDYPMVWNEIPAADYAPTNSIKNLKALANKSHKRVAKNDVFKLIDEEAKKAKSRKDESVYPLQYSKYKAKQDQYARLYKRIDDLYKDTPDLDFNTLQADIKVMNGDTTKLNKFNDWYKGLKKDPYLAEVINVMKDMAEKKETAEK